MENKFLDWVDFRLNFADNKEKKLGFNDLLLIFLTNN